MSPLDTIRTIGRPLAYYPAMAKHVGGVNAAIFLGQLLYWDERTENALGVHKTSEQWEEETGLTAKQQALVRSGLKKLGLLIETHRRLEHRIYFKLDHDAFNAFMKKINISQNAPKPDPEPNSDDQNNEGNGEQPEGDLPNPPKVIPPTAQRSVREQPKGKAPNTPKVNPLIETETTAETTTENLLGDDSPEEVFLQNYLKLSSANHTREHAASLVELMQKSVKVKNQEKLLILLLAFDRFWCAGLVKRNRATAVPAFIKTLKTLKMKPVAFANMAAADIEARKKSQQPGIESLHPTTYLNEQRWTDELSAIPSNHTSGDKHGNFANQDYSAGVADDGSF